MAATKFLLILMQWELAAATWASLGGPLQPGTWSLAPLAPTCQKQERISDRFLVIGHAGGDPKNHCENTIEATYSALNAGANAIEIDLSFSNDDVIFLWHDADPNSAVAVARSYGFALPGKCTPITRTGTPTWKLSYYEILKTLSYQEPVDTRLQVRRSRALFGRRPRPRLPLRRISRHQRPPTLNTWLSLFAKDPRLELIWLDVKTSPEVYPKFVVKLAELLDKYGVEDANLVLSVNSDKKAALLRSALREVRGEVTAARVVSDTVSLSPWVHSTKFLNGIVKGAESCGCCANLGAPVFAQNRWSAFKDVVNMNVRQRALHEGRTLGSRMNIFVWTIDDKNEMEWLVRNRVDGIITNRPGVLAAVAARAYV